MALPSAVVGRGLAVQVTQGCTHRILEVFQVKASAAPRLVQGPVHPSSPCGWATGGPAPLLLRLHLRQEGPQLLQQLVVSGSPGLLHGDGTEGRRPEE